MFLFKLYAKILGHAFFLKRSKMKVKNIKQEVKTCVKA